MSSARLVVAATPERRSSGGDCGLPTPHSGHADAEWAMVKAGAAAKGTHGGGCRWRAQAAQCAAVLQGMLVAPAGPLVAVPLAMMPPAQGSSAWRQLLAPLHKHALAIDSLAAVSVSTGWL